MERVMEVAMGAMGVNTDQATKRKIQTNKTKKFNLDVESTQCS